MSHWECATLGMSAAECPHFTRVPRRFAVTAVTFASDYIKFQGPAAVCRFFFLVWLFGSTKNIYTDIFREFKVTAHRKHEEMGAGSVTTSRAGLGGTRASS